MSQCSNFDGGWSSVEDIERSLMQFSTIAKGAEPKSPSHQTSCQPDMDDVFSKFNLKHGSFNTKGRGQILQEKGKDITFEFREQRIREDLQRAFPSCDPALEASQINKFLDEQYADASDDELCSDEPSFSTARLKNSLPSSSNTQSTSSSPKPQLSESCQEAATSSFVEDCNTLAQTRNSQSYSYSFEDSISLNEAIEQTPTPSPCSSPLPLHFEEVPTDSNESNESRDSVIASSLSALWSDSVLEFLVAVLISLEVRQDVLSKFTKELGSWKGGSLDSLTVLTECLLFLNQYPDILEELKPKIPSEFRDLSQTIIAKKTEPAPGRFACLSGNLKPRRCRNALILNLLKTED